MANLPKNPGKTSELRQTLKPYLPRVFVVSVLAGASSAAVLLFPVLLQKAVDNLSPGNSPVDSTDILLWLLFISVGALAVGILRDWYISRLAAHMDEMLSSALVRKILSLSLSLFRSIPLGEWNQTTRHVQDLKGALSGVGAEALFDLILCAGYSALVYYYDLRSGFVFTLTGLALLFVFHRFGRRLYGKYDAGFSAQAAAETRLMEGFHNAVVARSCALEPWLFQKWNVPYREFVRQFQRTEFETSLVALVISVVGRLIPVLALVLNLPRVSEGAMTMGTALAISTAAAAGFDPFLSISQLATQLQRAFRGAAQIDRALSLPSAPGDTKVPQQAALSQPPSVRFVDVSFYYEAGGRKRILKNTTFSLAPGEFGVIVGSSGSGKTTILHLLLRLFEKHSGDIFIGETEIGRFPLLPLRRSLAIVEQGTELFTGTIAENIAAGTSVPDLARVRRAAGLANAQEFIDKLPGGFDYCIGSDTGRLSAGQSQRIALARALYPDPVLLLLDEPASGLDAESEDRFYEALESIRGTKTVLMVEHRLKSALRADRIFVLGSDGQIVESGRHRELKARGGLYTGFWKSQLTLMDEERRT